MKHVIILMIAVTAPNPSVPNRTASHKQSIAGSMKLGIFTSVSLPPTRYFTVTPAWKKNRY